MMSLLHVGTQEGDTRRLYLRAISFLGDQTFSPPSRPTDTRLIRGVAQNIAEYQCHSENEFRHFHGLMLIHASESVDSPISYFGQKIPLSLDSKQDDIGMRRSRCSEEACISVDWNLVERSAKAGHGTFWAANFDQRRSLTLLGRSRSSVACLH